MLHLAEVLNLTKRLTKNNPHACTECSASLSHKVLHAHHATEAMLLLEPPRPCVHALPPEPGRRPSNPRLTFKAHRPSFG